MKNHLKDPFDPFSSPDSHLGAQSEDVKDLIPKIEALLSGPGSDLRTALIREMLAGVMKYHELSLDVLDIKIVNRALKELRHAFQVFQPYEHCLKVSIYGLPERLLTIRTFNLLCGLGVFSANEALW